jgi:CYTH domain-containing protein
MTTEIERKPPVIGDGWQAAALSPAKRVRIAGDRGFLTIKGPGPTGGGGK